MKQFLLLMCLMLTISAFSQDYEVDTIQGVVKVTNNLNGVVNYYTQSNEIRAYISSGSTNRNTINIVNSHGYQLIEAMTASTDVAVNGITYATNEELITALNLIFRK